MNELMSFWAQWLRPSAGLPTVQWSLLLAVAAMAGYLIQRHTGLPKVLGYSLVGTAAGLAGFSGAVWPLQGIGLFLLELGIALVLFECGGRISLRWFRHNPMVLVQSIAESALTYFAVYAVLLWLDQPTQVAGPLALVALAASPAVLTRVVADTRAARRPDHRPRRSTTCTQCPGPAPPSGAPHRHRWPRCGCARAPPPPGLRHPRSASGRARPRPT